MHITIEGATKLDGSYGIVNINLAVAMHRLGVNVSIAPWDQSIQDCRHQVEAAFGTDRPPITDGGAHADVRIRQIWPPIWSRPADGARLVVIQPWEFGSIPLSWLPGIEAVDAIWAYSSYVKAGYIQSGVDPDKVWVVPAGNDLCDPELAPVRRTRDDPLSILFLGGGIYRKGVDILVDALGTLPTSLLERTRLTIKETGFGSYYRNQSLVDMSLSKAPRVAAVTTVRRDHMPRAALADLVRQADVLVHPYRSEGFGLPVLEAMALGTPVVLTEGGATADFCGPGEAFHIPSDVAVGDSPFVGDLMTVDYPYVRVPRAQDLANILSGFAAGTSDIHATRHAAWERSKQFTWARVASSALDAVEALIKGHRVRDRFSQLTDDIARVLSTSDPSAALEAASALRDLGDHASAARLVAASGAHLGNTNQLTVALEILTRPQTPDLWSGAIWRMDIAAASGQMGTSLAAIHGHEGDDDTNLRIAGAIAPYFTTCNSVLDLGCGLGSMMRVLHAQGKAVLGVEADPERVKKLREAGLPALQAWLPEGLYGLDLPQSDGIFLGHIIEHMPPERALELLRWCSSHLNDKGVIVVQTPDFSLDVVAKGDFWLDPTHVRPYPLPLLKGMLESAGFTPLNGGCRSLSPVAPLDVLAVGRLRSAPQKSPAAVRSATTKATVVHIGSFSNDNVIGSCSHRLLNEHLMAAHNVDLVRLDVTATAPHPTTGVIAFNQAQNVSGDLVIVDVPISWLPDVLPRVNGSKRVVRLAFEAFPLPAYLVSALSTADEVWSVSRYTAEAASAGGVPGEKLRVVPLTLPQEWWPHSRTLPLADRGSHMVFSSVFKFEPRKNPEALLRAMASLAADGIDAHFRLNASGIAEGDFWSWADALLGSNGARAVQSTTELVARPLAGDELRTLVASSDAFVLPTRGEGFGLTFLGAMALGVPPICTGAGGHMDFCAEDNAYLVRSSSVPCLASWDVPLFRESRWQEVDHDDLVQAMTLAASDQALRAEKGHASLLRAARFHDSNGAGTPTELALRLL